MTSDHRRYRRDLLRGNGIGVDDKWPRMAEAPLCISWDCHWTRGRLWGSRPLAPLEVGPGPRKTTKMAFVGPSGAKIARGLLDSSSKTNFLPPVCCAFCVTTHSLVQAENLEGGLFGLGDYVKITEFFFPAAFFLRAYGSAKFLGHFLTFWDP